MPMVSVVIPCFNMGKFIGETLDSVARQTFRDFEVIVVDDGSTDPLTVEILNNLQLPNTKVIHTANQGLPSARNTGIANATGEIIFALDSDDMMAPNYLEKGVAAFRSGSNVGIVYCRFRLFGNKKGIWKLQPYSFNRMLVSNVINANGFFLKSDWQRVNGYNPNMKYGWEDWDFWLSIIELGREVVRIPEVLFYYRIRDRSMHSTMTPEEVVQMRTQLFYNHEDLYRKNIHVLFEHLRVVEKPFADRLREGGLPYLIRGIGNLFRRGP